MAARPGPQLSLFDAQAQQDIAILKITNERLYEEKAQCEERLSALIYRTQELNACLDEYRSIAQEYRAEVRRAQEEAQRWQSLYWLSQCVPHTAPQPVSDVAQLLLALTKLMHPDRWSQGQPASDLAHKAMCLINDLRGRGERA